MDRIDSLIKVRTGDTILFSNNAPTGSLLKIFVSSEWNHSGIVVRFIKDPITQKYKVSLTDEGHIFVLETNTGERYDEIQKTNIVGAGFSNSDWLFKKYNKIAIRKIKDIYRTEELSRLTLKFARKNLGNRFPTTSLKFIGVWLGVALAENDPKNKEMFCSEIMAHYYSYCIGQQDIYKNIYYGSNTINSAENGNINTAGNVVVNHTGNSEENKLNKMFGEEAPDLEELYAPEHYTFNKTPNAKIFDGKEEVFYQTYGDLLYIIFQPLILILLVILIIWITLPRK